MTFDVEHFSDALRAGIVGYSAEGTKMGRLRALYFFLLGDAVLKVQAKVMELESWHEIGTLVLQSLQVGEQVLPTMIPLGPNWRTIHDVEVLILEESGWSIERGLIIHNQINEQLLLLPGAFPHTVEISAPFYSGDFQPEYELISYRREPI